MLFFHVCVKVLDFSLISCLLLSALRVFSYTNDEGHPVHRAGSRGLPWARYDLAYLVN